MRRPIVQTKNKIDRKDFGLTWNTTLEAGGVLVGGSVKITIELEATSTAAANERAA